MKAEAAGAWLSVRARTMALPTGSHVFATIDRALNQLSEPAARRGGVDPVGINRRSIEVVHISQPPKNGPLTSHMDGKKAAELPGMMPVKASALLLASLFMAGCGSIGGNPTSPSPVAQPAPAPAPAPAPEPAPEPAPAS